MNSRRIGKWLLVLAGALLLLPVLIAGVLVVSGKLAISDPRTMLYRALGASAGTPTEAALRQLKVPAGLKLQIYAEGLPAVRFMHFTTAGDLLVSLPSSGQVVLLERDKNGDGKADGRRVVLKDLDRPHGLDIGNGWLYVGENKSVGRVRIDERTGQLSGEYQRIVTGLTGNGNHWTKTVRIGPDGKVYLAQGSTCNACVEKDQRRAAVMRFDADGSHGEIYASGLRNSVGMDWSPRDGALYATDNGRDFLGDDAPPDELNRIEQGKFYGWPYVHGFGLLDPEFGAANPELVKSAVPPVHGFRAHNAALGIHFLRNARVPKEYEHDALVALHGSWNRSRPDGYKVIALHWDDAGRITERDFLSGFLAGNGAIGRPVDVAEGLDGAIYVSDDFAGVVYRVAYSE